MKRLAYIGGIVGILLVLALSLRTDFGAIRRAFQAAGFGLAWLIPYRLLFYLLYAVGWRVILRPSDPQRRASLRYLLGVTVVRDAVDRLLPVASVGGSLVGIRLVQWRGLPTAPVAASVVIEILITLVVVYVFTAMGLTLLAQLGARCWYFCLASQFLSLRCCCCAAAGLQKQYRKSWVRFSGPGHLQARPRRCRRRYGPLCIAPRG
jgi:hypothetical protein